MFIIGLDHFFVFRIYRGFVVIRFDLVIVEIPCHDEKLLPVDQGRINVFPVDPSLLGRSRICDQDR
ncbi:MAG TPA: hypothetical protein EYN18_02820 [Nitrospirales bacterium]|nr:hypothetical protein [Nitrospirales bacterium]